MSCSHGDAIRCRLSSAPGFVFVTLPPPKGEKYAFSVPLANVYSILVYPVSQIATLQDCPSDLRSSRACSTGMALLLSSEHLTPESTSTSADV